jgi:predicted SnoaL-like aldol condensation-catalyzing enzyme
LGIEIYCSNPKRFFAQAGSLLSQMVAQKAVVVDTLPHH